VRPRPAAAARALPPGCHRQAAPTRARGARWQLLGGGWCSRHRKVGSHEDTASAVCKHSDSDMRCRSPPPSATPHTHTPTHTHTHTCKHAHTHTHLSVMPCTASSCPTTMDRR
jgi:hypothetical protein